MQDEPCLGCRVNIHMECDDPQPHDDKGFLTCCCWQDVPTIQPSGGVILGGYKQNDSIRDQTSTGRKRAAALYPITDGMACEWAGLKYAGGGAKPIVGCNGTVIYAAKGRGAIHHGPDKSTLNNEPGNVHRICTTCHNRWHTLNNPLYPEVRPAAGAPFIPLSGTVIPHDPETTATIEEIFKSEIEWQTAPKDRKVEVNDDGDAGD